MFFGVGGGGGHKRDRSKKNLREASRLFFLSFLSLSPPPWLHASCASCRSVPLRMLKASSASSQQVSRKTSLLFGSRRLDFSRDSLCPPLFICCSLTLEWPVEPCKRGAGPVAVLVRAAAAAQCTAGAAADHSARAGRPGSRVDRGRASRVSGSHAARQHCKPKRP